MAKGESDRRQTENLEKAKPGSLFAKALQSEFGGDLYNRTLGNLDPRKKAEETDRKSSKEKRYQAQFGDLKKTPKSDLDDAERELLKDDDSIPVKDTDARKGISKLLGKGLDAKLSLAESRVKVLSSDVSSVKNTLINTQKLIFDQNEMLGARFDQILEIFSAQQDYQKKIADEAEVRRRESELEAEKNLSATRKLESISGKKGKKSDILGDVLGVAADMLRGRGGSAVRKLLDSLKGKKGSVGSVLRAVSGLAQRGLGARQDAIAFQRYKDFRYNTKRSDTLEEVLGLSTRKSAGATLLDDLLGAPPSSSLNEGSRAARKADDAKALFNELTRQGSKFEDEIMGVDDLPRFLKEKGIPDGVFNDLIADGMDPKEVARLRNAAKNIRDSGGVARKASSAMGREVSEELASRAGAEALSKSGKTAATKALGKTGKFVPGLGTGIALAEAAYRFSQGDTVGALMSVGSAIPILGWGFTAFDIARDLGFDPLNTLPADQYERGSGLTEPGPAVLHGTEAILGSKDRRDVMDSYRSAIDQAGSALVSSSISLAEAAGMGQVVKSELKKTGLNYNIVSIPTSTKIGNTGGLSVISSLERDFNREIFAKRKEEQEKEIEEEEDKDPEEDGDDKGGGGNPPAAAPRTTPRLGGNGNLWNANLPANAITFDSEQGIDRSNDPGVDFSFNDIYKNYSVFDGTVVEVGNGIYGAGYGGVVVIRSKDPNDPTKEFDALYAHFAPGTQAVTEGQSVRAGDYIGPVGWVGQWPGGHPAPGAGGMTGPHTSLDFFEPNNKKGQITGPYSGKSGLQQYVLNLAGKSPAPSVSAPSTPERRLGPGSEPGGGKGGNPPPYRGIGGYGLRPDGTSGMNKVGDTIKGHDGKDYKLVPRKGYGYNQWVPVKLAMGMNPMVGRGRGIGGPDKLDFRNSIERRVYAALNSKGFTAAQIAAIMANFDIETGGYQTMYQDNGGRGRGLAQWETPGRWDQALEWYASQGKDPSKLINDVEGQIDWMMHEFTNIPTDSQGRPNLPYGFGYNLSDWKASSKDPAELSLNWMNWYEAPGVPHTERRVNSAKRYGKMFPRSQGEIDAQIRKNEADKLKYKDDPASFFGTNLSSSSNRMNSLYANSSMAEDMEETMVQQVYIINKVVASTSQSPIITSSKSSVDYVDQYRMAVLGA